MNKYLIEQFYKEYTLNELELLKTANDIKQNIVGGYQNVMNNMQNMSSYVNLSKTLGKIVNGKGILGNVSSAVASKNLLGFAKTLSDEFGALSKNEFLNKKNTNIMNTLAKTPMQKVLYALQTGNLGKTNPNSITNSTAIVKNVDSMLNSVLTNPEAKKVMQQYYNEYIQNQTQQPAQPGQNQQAGQQAQTVKPVSSNPDMKNSNNSNNSYGQQIKPTTNSNPIMTGANAQLRNSAYSHMLNKISML